MLLAREIQRFHVGIKAFILRDGQLLLLRESVEPSWWEIPGGRIDVGEEALPPEEVLQRELREELGTDFRYRIDLPLVTWIRPPHGDRKQFAFLVGFLCRTEGGEIRLSDEHSELRWVDRDSWQDLSLAPGYEWALEEFWKRVST
ncbi:NUDIX domain-containing protein [Candidatus Acetothermia bacterium]|nr:NUDIX domain-containing protein [Candidatus Acetothermia bacterium]